MASDSESDYELELSEETRKILQQVMAEKEAETERFEALKRQAESDFDQAKQADMSLFTENWQLSQFWYDDETSRALGQEALDNTNDSSVIVCISSPSAFVKLMSMEPPKNAKIYVFEFDTRFDIYGEQFVHYDFNHPDSFRLLDELKGKVDYIIADPPFLSDECLTKTLETVDVLRKPETGKVLFCTGAKMTDLLLSRQYTLTSFDPKHKGGLSNDFRSYSNYTSVKFPTRHLNISTTISHISNHNTLLAHQEKRQEYEQEEAQPDRQVYLSQLFLASQLSMDLEDILDSPDLDSCQMCHQSMRLAKTFALQAPDLVPGLLRELCLKYKFRRPDTCEGLWERLGPELIGIFSELNLDGSDGYYTCAYAFPGSCPLPVHQPNPITFPKPKPANAQQPPPSGETIQVLHFSDWHVDPLYQRGSEAKCSHNICCRDYGRFNDPGPIKKPASKWGESKCDTPIALGVSALEAIQKFVPEAAFGIFTGDIVSHDSWMITQKYVEDEETRSYELFKQYLQEIKLYVALGNHDSYPSDQAPGKERPNSYITHKWLYDHVADIWEKNNWITSVEADYAKSHNAMFMTRPMPGLKLITLNTDLYYVRNYFTMLDTEQDDPSGLFHDLILELQDSEDRGERVWIMGHMAPVARSLPRSSILFQRIVARYSPHVIAGLFFGHFHLDKFIVMHDPDLPQGEDSAVNVVYQGPSVTPNDRMNPGIRWYDVDAKTFSILDSHTAIADVMTHSTEWELNDQDPLWTHEYSAKALYADRTSPEGSNENPAASDPLSPQFWYSAVERMRHDRDLFKQYLEFQSKSSSEAKPCPKDSACERETLCQMQASTVIAAEACIEEEVAAHKHGKASKKASKKAPFGRTRAGREIMLQEYDAQRGVMDGLAAMAMIGIRRLERSKDEF
ncbi:hypothetical protein BGZ59_005522 [Podila verticillata]|nr:hypothetical protein BGZ59_005522 [Podila verticillata]